MSADAQGGGITAAAAGDPELLYRYASELDACANDLETLEQANRRITGSVRDAARWSGAAAETYSSFCAQVAGPLPAAPAHARSIAAALRRHAEAVAAAQRQGVEPHEATAAAHALDKSGTAETRAVEESRQWYQRWWEDSEPVRQRLEGVLAPLDIVAADHWIDLLERAAGQPSEWISEVDQLIKEAGALRAGGQSATAAIIKAAEEAETVGGKLDAWGAFAPGWLRTAAGGIAGIRGLSGTLTGLGLVADAGTIISPGDKGAMGWVDRGAAGVNGALLVANMAMDEIPVVGEVVMVGTGVYLAGDYLYHHWTPFRNVCNDVGHATVNVATDVGHAASAGWHDATSFVGGLFS